MKLKDIERILGAEVLTGTDLLETDIKMACGSDLMSDVLSFVKSESLLLTGLTNPQVVRTAEIADLAAVCFVRGKKPNRETIEMAESKNIPLLTTLLPMFESCGRLYQEGLAGCSEYKR
ncbi:MAG TPA: DRTGG domain-containing protein [Sedimentisphaerales bacterium]|nr:DRTGG domain-containing protein [Sedimentisphaerales bacterium]